MTLIPDRDRRDILRAVEAKHAAMLRGAHNALAENNIRNADYYLGRAEHLQRWIDELERLGA